MCGLAFISVDNVLKKDKRFAKFEARAEKSLHNRGPDHFGVYIGGDGNLKLCHARLSIIELSALANQPMSSSSGRYIVVFNGEIYNNSSLRENFSP